jgi:sigma-E factor negative regulatory protein RseA
MKTEEINSREQISALADGELNSRHVDSALATLRSKEARDDWDVYHQIGDVLRSDDMAVNLSAGFAARMAARLEVEPTIIAPAMANSLQSGGNVRLNSAEHPASDGRGHERKAKQWAMPGMVAAAAMASIAFVAAPQLMVAFKGGETANAPMVASTRTQTHSASANAELSPNAVVATTVAEGVVLRDPSIDDYLLAHQRFSPSLYSTAQYARSATFATDSDK